MDAWRKDRAHGGSAGRPTEPPRHWAPEGCHQHLLLLRWGLQALQCQGPWGTPCVSEQGALAFGGQAAARCTQMVLWGPVPSTFALGFRVQMQLCQAEQCCLLLLTVNAAFIQLSLPGAPNVMCSLLRCAMSATGAAVTQAPTKPSCGRRKMVVAARGASQDAQTIPQAVMPLNSSHEAISK